MDGLKKLRNLCFGCEVFQEFEGAAVRVSFDEDVQLTSLKNLSYEEALDPSCRIDKHLVFNFPIGILEVKQAFKTYQEMEALRLPEWVMDMCDAGLAIEVEKFSKYLTGNENAFKEILLSQIFW